MPKKDTDKNKIIHIPRGSGSNVAKLIFILIMFGYIVFTIYSYSQKTTVNYYEVEEGSIVREHIYDGLILREETVVSSEGDGYINFYVASGKKVAVGTPVYSIDESGSLNEYIESHSDELQSFSDTDIQDLHRSLQSYVEEASDLDFGRIYDLSSDISAKVTEYKNLSILSNLSEELRASGISFMDSHSTQTGMISYVIDGYEDVQLSEIDESLFDRTAYERKLIGNGELIASGDPAYKLITSDNWKIVFRMNDQDIADFGEASSLKISLSDTGISTTASFETMIGADGNSYGVLSLTGFMTYFAEDRFLSFEITQNNVSGLKIPERSITTKNFYIIPSAYLSQDDTGSEGFYKEVITEEGTASVFTVTDIYNNDGEYCYIECTDTSPLKAGDVVVSQTDSQDRYMISQQKPLEGVYNINKGYTVFKRIERLETSNGYCIIAKNTSYGLSVYDHIVLDASVVGDGQLLYR